jgi:serine/threonine protein kinase
MHARGVIHRDLKPEIVMVQDKSTCERIVIKVVDVGFALIESSSSSKPGKLLIGTPG